MLNFNEYFRKSPFARFIVPLILGIMAALYIPGGFFPETKWLLLVGLLFISAILVSFKFSKNISAIISGMAINLFFVLFGIILVQMETKQEKDASILFDSDVFVSELIDLPVEKENTYRILLRTKGLRNEEEWSLKSLKVLAYVEKSEEVRMLAPGDKLIIHAKARKFESAGNPGEFNYPRYMSDRRIYGSVYVKNGEWRKTHGKQDYSLSVIPAILRNKAFHYLQKSLGNGNALALTSALLLGERDYIDDEVKSSFANTGVIHIMAVSGLHVGIIYIILLYLLSFLNGLKHGKKIKMLIVVLALWMYAFITGMSPSVLRAVTMFSFVAIGQGLKRSANIYNSLAISAFFLLCINPYFIRDVGFQLSFTAVFGIVFLYPKIYPLLSSRYWLLDKIWMLMVVSFSAQLATFPIVAYYFHQFPNYFLLTNILAIPLVTLIIYLGVLLLIFSFSTFISSIFSFLLTHVVNGLLAVVQTVNSFAFAVTKPIFLDQIGSILLYMILFAIILFLIVKRVRYLNFSLFLVLVFIGWTFSLKIKTVKQKSFSIPNVNGISVIQFVDGNRAYLITSASSDKEKLKVARALDGYWNQLRVRDIQWVAADGMVGGIEGDALYIKDNYFQFYELKGILYKLISPPEEKYENPLRTNVLVFSGAKGLAISQFSDSYLPDNIVVDSSVPWYFSDQIAFDCALINHDCFQVSREGAYEVTFE